jgi:hypothetical protein
MAETDPYLAKSPDAGRVEKAAVGALLFPARPTRSSGRPDAKLNEPSGRVGSLISQVPFESDADDTPLADTSEW